MKKTLVVVTMIFALVLTWALITFRNHSPTIQPVSLATSGTNNDDDARDNTTMIYEIDNNWLAQHDEQFSLHQTYTPQTVTNGDESVYIYHHRIRAKSCILDIASEDNRDGFKRHIVQTWTNNVGAVEARHLTLTVPVTFPSSDVSPGGVFFNRNEEPITSFGIIIPEVKSSPERSPTDDRYLVTISMEGGNQPSELWDQKNLVKTRVQKVDQNLVLLMPTKPMVKLDSARVLWFRLSDNHKLERASN